MTKTYMEFRSRDSSIRPVEERDIKSVADLFRLNYGEGYQYTEVLDGTWVKNCIYGDSGICLVLEEGGEVLAIGAVIQNSQSKDQIGEIARLVVNPNYTGSNLGSRIIEALFDLAGENLEFAFGRTRTANIFSQKVMGRAGFIPAGLLPCYLGSGENREDSIVVIKLQGNGAILRSEKLPQVIPEVAPLAKYVLKMMGLPTTLMVVSECPPYPTILPQKIRPLDRLAIAQLARTCRLNAPLLIGGVSLEDGFSAIHRNGAVYLSTVDTSLSATGAIGYIYDKENRLFKVCELVAEDDDLRGQLCQIIINEAEKLGADAIEVNISAYEVRLQRSFLDWGFKPVAYLPALVFRDNERLDIIKMMKLYTPYGNRDLQLTEECKSLVEIIQPSLINS